MGVPMGAAPDQTFPGYLLIGQVSPLSDSSRIASIARYGFQRTDTPLTALPPSLDTYKARDDNHYLQSSNNASYLSKHPTLNVFYNRKGRPHADVSYLYFNPTDGTASSLNSGISLGNLLGAGPALIAPNGRYLLYQRAAYTSLIGHSLDPPSGAIHLNYSGVATVFGLIHHCDPTYRGLIHPNSKFAIVPCKDMFHVITINPETGNPGGGGAYDIAGAVADDIAIQTNGNFVYTLNSNIPNIGQFSMDPDTGVLTQLAPASVSTPDLNPSINRNTRRMVVNPGANFLYVAGEGLLLSYSFSAQTGLLTYLETINMTLNGDLGLPQTHDITFDETGEYMFVTSSRVDSVAVIRVNKTTGALSVVKYMDTLAPEETLRPEGSVTIIYMKGL